MLLVEARSLSFSHPGSPAPLFERLDFTIDEESRVGLVGPNGCGKTTLLRLVLGGLEPEAGLLRRAEGLAIGYLPQYPEDAACRGESGGRAAEARLGEIASSFGLAPSILSRPFADLSGGEKTKAALTRILAEESDFLVLDEPTNHLEAETIEAFERALSGFRGGVLFASHDRAFVEAVATLVLDIEDYGASRTSGDPT